MKSVSAENKLLQYPELTEFIAIHALKIYNMPVDTYNRTIRFSFCDIDVTIMNEYTARFVINFTYKGAKLFFRGAKLFQYFNSTTFMSEVIDKLENLQMIDNNRRDLSWVLQKVSDLIKLGEINAEKLCYLYDRLTNVDKKKVMEKIIRAITVARLLTTDEHNRTFYKYSIVRYTQLLEQIEVCV